MNDKRCIKEIQNGHKEYLNDIAEKYYNDIYHFCCYQTGSTQDSYDLAQEVFFRFIRYVDNYRYLMSARTVFSFVSVCLYLFVPFTISNIGYLMLFTLEKNGKRFS